MEGVGMTEEEAAMLLIMLVAIVTWVASFLIIRAISRYREYVADRDGAVITGKPSKLASALLKISGTMKRIPTRDLREVEGMNAFFIMPALSGDSLTNLFSTHPPVAQRVKKLMEMEACHELSFFKRIRNNIDRKRLPRGDSESLFSLSSAYLTLEIKLGLKVTGRCAVTFKTVSGTFFYEMEQDVRQFLGNLSPSLTSNGA